MFRRIAFAVLVLVGLWGEQGAQAQMSGMSGGSSGMSGSSGNLPGSSSSMFGSSGMGSSSMLPGTSSMGGGMGSMGGGMGGSSGMGPQGMAAPLTAQQQLMQNRQAGGFVGTTAQQMQRSFTGVSQGTQTALNSGQYGPADSGGQTFAGMPQGSQGAGFGGAQGGRSQPAIRCTLTVGFDLPQHSLAAVNTALAERLGRVPAIQARKPIQVVMEAGKIAVLRGEVATEHGRALAGQLARLEAGIEQVKNEIVVTGTTPTGPQTPAPQASQGAQPASLAPSATIPEQPLMAPESRPAPVPK
jgi:hypothetical protein